MCKYSIGLKNLGVDIDKVTSTGYTTCPKCSETRKQANKNKKVFRVSLETGNYHCSHCEIKGRVDSNEWLGKEDEYKANLANNTTKKTMQEIKPYYTTKLTKEALNWLKTERGISAATAEANKLSFHKGALCLNYYIGNDIVGAKYRLINSKKFWQHITPRKFLYGLNDIENKDTAIFVEGEFDKLALYECGIKNAVSVAQGAPNAGSDVGTKLQCLDNSIEYIKDLKKVILACDNDENGKYLTSVLIERFGANRCAVVEFPDDCKDMNDVLLIYGTEKVKYLIDTAKETPITGVRTVEQSRGKLLDNYFNGVKKGISAHIPELEGVFSWYKDWWHLWTGIPNSGKSAWIHFIMMVMSVHEGWKWAIFSPEHYPEEDFFIDMIELLTGRPTDEKYKNRLSLEEFELAMDFINEHFYFVYPQLDSMSNTRSNVLSKVKELKLAKGIDGFLIDPYNQLVRESSDKIDVLLEKSLIDVDTICKTHHLVGNIIAHPKNQSKEKDQDDYKRPTPYDIAGGAMWYNKTYVLGCVHRPFNQSDKHDKSVEIDIQKVKSHKRVGTPDCVTLEFNPVTGWYYSVIDGSCALDGAFNEILKQKGLEANKLTGAYLPEDLDDDGDPLPF